MTPIASTGISIWRPCVRIRFDVIDTGIGIAEEHIAMLFQPFSQVDASVRRRFGGTGLGLVISKRLAGMLGGDITVSSLLGKGTTFSASIATGSLDDAKSPRHSADADERSVAAQIDSLKLNCRILLAEDGPFDLILMDVQMPVMDGYEAPRKLREMGYRGPILALTAHAMKEDRQKCLDAGCDDYLTKPVDRATLLQQVSKYAARPRSQEPQNPGCLIPGHSA